MTIIIDAATVAVDTFADLSAVLTGSNTYTLVYLAADITMSAGIAILPSKTEIIIDGRYPADGTGTVHTLTEYSSSDAGHTLGIRSAGSISMTVRNMTIVGRNYYGILYVPEGTAYAGVTVSYENITYTGPQITYNPSGKTRYIDCSITIVDGHSPMNEVGEVYQVEIGGTTTIAHNSTSHAAFWFRGPASSPSLTFLEDSHVTITGGYDGIYTTYPVALTVKPAAHISINLQRSFSRSSSHRFASVLIDTEAYFYLEQEVSSGTATLYCNGAFTVNQGAKVFFMGDYTSAKPLIYFYTASSALILNDPDYFVLYNIDVSTVLYFLYATSITINSHQINFWRQATARSQAGGFDDIPNYKWKKPDDSLIRLTATNSNTGFTVLSHNFTDEELAKLPALSSMMLQIARCFSVGKLPLAVDTFAADGHPITGTTFPGAVVQATYTVDGTTCTLEGTADKTGSLSVNTGGVIPQGIEITVEVNIPFLLNMDTVVTREPGKLELLSAPVTIPFLIRPISQNPTLFGRENALTVTVSDTRARSLPWYLYATIDSPMTSDTPGHILTDSLVNVDASRLQPLSSSPILVSSSQGNQGVPGTADITWPDDQGILMQATTEPIYTGEHYNTVITWTLTDTPLETEE